MQGDYGYSFEYQLPVNEVVGDRLWLTVLVSFVTILFTWLIAFPIGIYSATHQYSWGDWRPDLHRLDRYRHSELHVRADPDVLRQYLVRHVDRPPDGPANTSSEPMSWEQGKVHPLEHL